LGKTGNSSFESASQHFFLGCAQISLTRTFSAALGAAEDEQALSFLNEAQAR
jgi:hypothetical protein